MVLRENVVNMYVARKLVDRARQLLSEIGNRSVRVRDTRYSSADLQKFVNMGLVEVVARETEKREVPIQRSYYGRRSETRLIEVETGREIDNISDMRIGYTYKYSDKKIVDACYNVYRLTFRDVNEVRQAIKDQLSKAYGEI